MLRIGLAVLGAVLRTYAQAPDAGQIIDVVGAVEFKRAGSLYDTWDRAVTNALPLALKPGDEVRTKAHSTAGLRLYPGVSSDKEETIRMDPDSRIRLAAKGGKTGFFAGLWHFFGRSSSESWEWETERVYGSVGNTDFILEVTEDGQVTIHVAQGLVRATLRTNATETLDLRDGDSGRYDPRSGRLERLPRLDLAVKRLAQTFLYYPGVVELGELGLDLDRNPDLADSLEAYAVGNLNRAVSTCPWDTVPGDNSRKLFYAALLLGSGQHQDADSLARSLSPSDAGYARHRRIAEALLQTMAGAQTNAWVRAELPQLQTEWLAESYYQQSRAGYPYEPSPWERDAYRGHSTPLERALIAAKRATPDGSTNGFGWVRRAELEFSFGRIREATAALAKSGAHTNHNAQAVALLGFLSWAEQDDAQAAVHFRRSAELDPRLGNAWLGSGLTEIHGESLFAFLRQGRLLDYWRARPDSAGLRSLEAAAAAEPYRSLLRSYLGKAYYDASGFGGPAMRQLRTNAFEQLALAQRIDPLDPTPHLYSALLKRSENRINEAVTNLETSQQLNQNRMAFRSGALLDQDQAVRSANLAKIYGDAGLYEASLKEASRAVAYDYANYSAHLFLANSYYALLDPSRFNLRYETVWFNELLLANLLAPVGAGAFSPQISQQEYSRLFESTGPGLSLTTLVRSDRDYRQIASQFARFDRFEYSLDLDFQDREGRGPNNDLSRLEWYSQFKVQMTPDDHLFVLTKYQEFDAGDNFQYYDPTIERNRTFRFTEDQAPLLAVGYNHTWQPEVRTLILGAWMRSRMHAEQQDYGAYRFGTNTTGDIVRTRILPFAYAQDSSLDLGSLEVQQVIQRDRQFLLVGGRVQAGTVAVRSEMRHASGLSFDSWPDPVSDLAISKPLNRWAGYLYYTVEPWDDFWLTAGVSYDWLEYPANWRHPPLAAGTDQISQWSPKAGLVWNLSPTLTLRAAYAQSMAGVTLEDSFRLEPAQLAGFPQAFRTLISERLIGSVAAPAHEIAVGALDLSATPWYATVSAGWLGSEVKQAEGSFWGGPSLLNDPTTPGQHETEVHYEEVYARASLSRLIGRHWALGAGAQSTHSTFGEAVQAPFDSSLPNAAPRANDQRSDLWRGFLFGAFNHPSGWFAKADLSWYAQSNAGPGSPGPGDSFPMVNLEAGYRFWKRHGEIALGGLNLADIDYHLHPLTPYQEMPRESVAYLRLRLNF